MIGVGGMGIFKKSNYQKTRKDLSMACRSEEEKKAIKSRLRRISGQISGIEKMIDEDRDCMEILTQISSASGALQGLWSKVIERHLKVCISRAISQKDEKPVNELVEYLRKVKP